MAKVLFLCIGNAGRSQMAQAFLERLPGKSYIDWGLEDPAGQPLERVRELRDEIEQRVRELARRLDSARAASA